MSIFIRSPKTEKDYLEYFQFRWKMLREPHGQDFGTEKDNLEDVSFHVMLIHFKEVIGIGRIHFMDDRGYQKGQIRYMAIHYDYQNKGYGTKILKALELHAKEKNVGRILLNSRSNALEFYKKNGYKTVRKAHLLFNEIQHWLMEKRIT